MIVPPRLARFVRNPLRTLDCAVRESIAKGVERGLRASLGAESLRAGITDAVGQGIERGVVRALARREVWFAIASITHTMPIVSWRLRENETDNRPPNSSEIADAIAEHAEVLRARCLRREP